MSRSRNQARDRSGDQLDWLTLGEAARYLGVAQSTIRKWSDGGRLRAFYTPGGHRRFRRGDLDAFVGGSRGGVGSAGVAGGRILIVDDDERLREYVRVNLEMAGYEVREAGSAEEGLSALEDEPPDLILLDVEMPRMNGWEMLKRVQERHGVGAVPVIMFSGKSDETSDAANERGAQAFIGKPFDPQELIESTKQFLRA